MDMNAVLMKRTQKIFVSRDELPGLGEYL